MHRWTKKLGGSLGIFLLILGLSCLPAGATVKGDLAAGLPLDKVVANGLAAGTPLESIVSQSLDQGADSCALLKAILKQDLAKYNLDFCKVFKAVSEACLAHPRSKGSSELCSLVKCAVEAGFECPEIGNCLVALTLAKPEVWQMEQVRVCLDDIGCTPPPPPATRAVFPGQGQIPRTHP